MNLNNLNVQEMNHAEMLVVEGGILPFLIPIAIGFVVGAATAYWVS